MVESCRPGKYSCPCAIRAAPLGPILWASLPGLMIFSNPELDGLVRTLG